MVCKTFCATITGMDARIVQIEADVNDGMPIFQLVGCLNSEVREAKERVRSAIKNMGWRFPPKRVTVNISPADIRKEGTIFDLGIAIALLKAFGYFDYDKLGEILFAGELSLDGHINAVNGILPVVIAARDNGFKYCMVPKENICECNIVSGIGIIGISSVDEVIEIIERKEFDEHVVKCEEWNSDYQNVSCEKNFSDVQGQAMIKRAVMISVAGGHNMLMQGPPGTGKTMIAERITGIMPPLNKEESLEIAKIKSISNSIGKNNGYVYERPFRMPHHSIPPTGLVGGGNNPKMGEISYAHRGVLFLDELCEYKKDIVELLRIPLEKKKIIHSRSNLTVEYPCDFLLIAAMNPCPCGYYPDRTKCTCSSVQIRRYLGKVSYPILDRIDIVAQVQGVSFNNICNDKYIYEESTEYMREKILEVCDIQKNRFRGTDIRCNSMMNKEMIHEYCRIDNKTKDYITDIYNKTGLSARGYFKVLKVSRTIADFENEKDINISHIKEAIMYRSIDRYISDNADESRDGYDFERR